MATKKTKRTKNTKKRFKTTKNLAQKHVFYISSYKCVQVLPVLKKAVLI